MHGWGETSPVKRALHASSNAAWRTLLIITSISASALPLWKPIIPMFQHAPFSCLKWISGSSLVFRPSSSANLNHLGGMTVTPVAAREQREWITRREREWKERLLFQEANHHRSFEPWVTSWAALFFFPLSPQFPPWGRPGTADQSLRTSGSQWPALIYNYHASVAIPLEWKGCLLHEEVNNYTSN